ncbi:MAG: hypothetical protein QXI37_04485, partial [Thermoprotei archaeon]
LPIVSPLGIIRDFLAVPLSITILGLLVYRFSPAYRVNRGKYWAIRPNWVHAEQLVQEKEKESEIQEKV